MYTEKEINVTTKRFYLVLTNERDAYEAVFPTMEDAIVYRDYRENSTKIPIELDIQCRMLDFNTLDEILEGENTLATWEQVK